MDPNAADNGDKKIMVQRFPKFRVQFVWQPKSGSEQPAGTAGGAAAVAAVAPAGVVNIKQP
jgi:hypothetical protein